MSLREGQSWRCKHCGGYAILTRVNEPALGRGGQEALDAMTKVIAFCLDCDGVPNGKVRASQPFPARPPRVRRRMTI